MTFHTTTDEILLDLFNRESPFGPTNARLIVDERFVRSHDPKIVRQVLSATFSTDCEVYSEYLRDPSLIVGRRGAGKTAFLNSTRLDSAKHIVIDLPEAKTFSGVMHAVNEVAQKGNILVDLIAELWDAILWCNVLARVAHADGNLAPGRTCNTFMRGLAVEDLLDSSQIMNHFLDFVGRADSQRFQRLPEHFESIRVADGPSFREAKDAATSYLRLNGVHVTLLLDSLDDLRLDAPNMRDAVSGLLKCQGEFSRPGVPCRLRVCLPAEMYYELERISVNRNKDFGRKMLIRWRARELFQLAARRYLVFLRLNDSSRFASLANVDVSSAEGLRGFWEVVMPRSIRNSEEAEEGSFAYIARHTQLLPRHLLMSLNAIARKSGGGGGAHFKAEAIRAGIEEVENTLCGEIFEAFRLNYPAAETACTRCIRYLPRVFDYGELHHVFNLYGQGLVGIADFDEFRDMLARVGVLGKVVGGTDRYAEGEFEYYIPNPLNLRSEDRMCVHPVFSRVFNARKDSRGASLPNVLARGANVDDDEVG